MITHTPVGCPHTPPMPCRPVQISTVAASMPARHSLRNDSAPRPGSARTPQLHRASLARSRIELRTTLAWLERTRLDRIAYRIAAHRTRHSFQACAHGPQRRRRRCDYAGIPAKATGRIEGASSPCCTAASYDTRRNSETLPLMTLKTSGRVRQGQRAGQGQALLKLFWLPARAA